MTRRDELGEVFGADAALLEDEAVDMIYSDMIDAEEDDGCSPLEYARRIGKGNLVSYARCLAAGAYRRKHA